MRRTAIHDLVRKVAFGRQKSKTDILAKALLKVIGDYADKEGVDAKDLVKAIYDMGIKRTLFGGDVLIEISGMDVSLKNGKTARKACAPKIRVFGKENGDYSQAGMIQNLSLVVHADDLNPVFEVTYPKHPLLSDMAKKSIARSGAMLRKAGADITYRKLD